MIDTTTAQFAAEIASIRRQILASQAKRGITLATETRIQEFRRNALKQAYAAYDKAIAAGETVIEFTNDRGADMRDR